jgi:hypothetical protein
MTGWGLEFILWELPYAGGLEMLHAEMCYNGQTVRYLMARRTGGTAAGEDARAVFARMRRERRQERAEEQEAWPDEFGIDSGGR